MSDDDRVRIELSIDLGGAYRPVRCRLVEAASETTHAVVEIAAGDDLDLEAALGSQATLTVTAGDLAERTWTLLVGAIEFSRLQHDTLRYDVHLHAHPWLLGHTRNTRKFQGMSAEQIIAQVLSAHDVRHTFRLTRSTAARDYCVQYGESDLDFVARMLEFEGIYFTFDDDGTMLLEDRSSAAAPVTEGAPPFELLDAGGAFHKGALGIFELRRGARVAPGRVTLNDFNWKTPKKSLLAASSGAADQELEIYDYPAGFREPGEGELLARLRVEAHRAGASFVEGAGNVPTFAPGRSFSFGAAGGAMFEGDYFLVRCEHTAHDVSFFAEARGGEAPYANRFRAIPLAVPFRPEVRTPRPTIGGSHTAMVRGPAGEEIHTDKFGRFRAQFHWDREAKGTDQDSRWIRMLQETATSMVLARTGWEMSVAYIDGDPDRPIGMARAINGVMPPAYAQPANKNAMTIKTPSSPATGGYNEIKLEDTAGAMLFSVRAEKDHASEIKHDKTEIIGHDEKREVGNDLEHTVGRDQSIVIGHDSKETIELDRHLAIKGNRDKTVSGSETVDVGSNVTISTAQDESESEGSVRMTFAGGIQMPDIDGRVKSAAKGLVPTGDKVMSTVADGAVGSALEGSSAPLTSGLQGLVPSASGFAAQATGGLSDGFSAGKLADQFLVGSIRRTATEKTSRTVGGAFISAGIGDISATVGKAYIETIGGLKLTTTMTGAISEAIGGQLAVTVGGAIVRSSVTDMVVSADVTMVTVGLLADLSSSEQIRVTAPVIAIEGLMELDFSVEGAGLKLTSTGAEMLGAVQIKAGESMIVTGKNTDLAPS